MTQVEKRRRFIINVTYFVILLTFVALFLKFAFYPMLPIFIALLIALILQKPMKFLSSKTKIPKSVIGTALVLLLIFLIVLGLYLIGDKAIAEISGFASLITERFTDYEWIETQVTGFIDNLPAFIRDSVSEKTAPLLKNLENILSDDPDIAENNFTISLASFDYSKLFSGVKSGVSFGVSGVIATAKQIPSILVALIIGIVLSCFITIEYDEIIEIINSIIGPQNSSYFEQIRRVMRQTVGKLGKSYAIICFMTFVELTAGLLILKLMGIYEGSYLFIISLITAVLDIMPVLGIGTVMWPWMAWCLFSKNTAMLIGLLCIYAVITVIRHIIEPKLISDAIELPPAIMLTVMYIGLKFFSVIGMFAFIIILYCLVALNNEGIIHITAEPPKHTKEPKPSAAKKPLKLFRKKS